MRGRYKVLLMVVIGLAVCAVAVWQFLQPRGVFAAKYQGHTLAYWLARYENSFNGPYGYLREVKEIQQEAVSAVLILCTNHLPELARAVNYDPAPRKARVEAGTSWLPRKFRKWLVAGPLADHARERAETAEDALIMLGPRAAAAIPEIENIILGPNSIIAHRASSGVLPFLGTNSVPWLLTLMADENHPRQAHAIQTFYVITGLWRNSTNPAALPALLRCLQSTNPYTAWFAAASLGNMQLEPGLCIPALTSALSNSAPHVRTAAMQALGKFHENARAALPGLVQTAQAPGSDVGFQPVGVMYQAPGQISPGTYTNTAPASAVPSVRELFFERPGLPGSR